MNDHVGWDKNGRCVFCFSKDASAKCVEPNINEMQVYIMNLQRELEKSKSDVDWWMKKHQQDCMTMRIIGRREGAHEMQSIISDLVWGMRHDDFLISEIENIEYEEEHQVNCKWWRDWHECNCKITTNK